MTRFCENPNCSHIAGKGRKRLNDNDKHNLCLRCLGLEHIKMDACEHCLAFSNKSYRARLQAQLADLVGVPGQIRICQGKMRNLMIGLGPPGALTLVRGRVTLLRRILSKQPSPFSGCKDLPGQGF